MNSLCNCKVLIVDDHALFRKSVNRMLSGFQMVSEIEEAENGEVAIGKFNNIRYDLVFLDIQMPVMDGNEFLSELKKRAIQTRIVILSMHDFNPNLFDFKAIEIAGFLSKSASEEEVIEATGTILTGGSYFMDDQQSDARYSIPKEEKVRELAKLTPQEIRIIKSICDNLDTKQIAEKHFISEHTVNNHRSNIMKKIGAHNSIGIVRYAFKFGIYHLNLMNKSL